MKYYYSIQKLLLFLCLILMLACSKEKVETTLNMVTHYVFDGSDLASGSSNPSFHRVEYKDGYHPNHVSSLSFDGSGYVYLDNEYDYESKTISIWFYLRAPNAGDKSIVYVSDNPGLNYGITALSIKVFDSYVDLYYNINGVIDTVNIEKAKWYNAVLTSQNMNYGFYLNGDKISSGDFLFYKTSIDGHRSAVLGSSRGASKDYFNGLINDFRAYNVALTESEIALIYKEE